jgi:hypothetical protein
VRTSKNHGQPNDRLGGQKELPDKRRAWEIHVNSSRQHAYYSDHCHTIYSISASHVCLTFTLIITFVVIALQRSEGLDTRKRHKSRTPRTPYQFGPILKTAMHFQSTGLGGASDRIALMAGGRIIYLERRYRPCLTLEQFHRY